MDQFAYILLPALLFLVFTYARKDVKEYEAFKQIANSLERQKKYREWLFKSFFFLGLLSLLSLTLLGKLYVLTRLYQPFTEILPDDFLTQVIPNDTSIAQFITGILISIWVASILISFFLRRKPQFERNETKFIQGDVEALIPRNNSERLWVALLSLNAGFSEELFFRLLLPMLIFVVTGNHVGSLVGSVLLFGIGHYYQGWRGVIATTIFGAGIMMLYLIIGNIWIIMGVHAFVDINNLIMLPWLKTKLTTTSIA